MINDEEMIMSAKCICKSYKSGEEKIRIFSDFSIDIKRKEIIAIVGPSGCGKSTLLNILSGIDKPDSGEVLYNGADIFKMKDKESGKLRLHKFGFVYQDFQLISTLSVVDNVLVPALAAKTCITFDEVKLLCESLGLKDRMYHYPHQLSGGERQRVSIARALVNHPSIIFADEATGNLDYKNSIIVMDILKKCCNEYGASLVYVTHNLELTNYADRVIYINQEVDNE